MTRQATDSIFYEGKRRPLHSWPLEDFFKAGYTRPDAMAGKITTACWRGYVACWEIRDDSLLLADISMPPGAFKDLLDLNDGLHRVHPISKELKSGIFSPAVKATWYTGTLEIPDGLCIDAYPRTGFACYEKTILLHVQRGRVVKMETRNNLTLDTLADLWVRSGGNYGRRKILFEAMARSPLLDTNKELWRFPDTPPFQLKEPITEVTVRRGAFCANLEKFHMHAFESPEHRRRAPSKSAAHVRKSNKGIRQFKFKRFFSE